MRDAMNLYLATWAAKNGSELVKMRMSDGFDWLSEAVREWTDALGRRVAEQLTKLGEFGEVMLLADTKLTSLCPRWEARNDQYRADGLNVDRPDIRSMKLLRKAAGFLADELAVGPVEYSEGSENAQGHAHLAVIVGGDYVSMEWIGRIVLNDLHIELNIWPPIDQSEASDPDDNWFLPVYLIAEK